MADFAHLEKMGRELKCPICLSLLSSAVSLTCNHAFCNLCLNKSMKSDSSCPVCKVPYRRREIRPAPHMDNLVSIYKTMEVASGVSIHVTQNAPTKATGGVNQLENNSQLEKLDSTKVSCGSPKKCRNFKKKAPKDLEKSTDETSDSHMKPSFPAKKRVHVPKCLPSETPTRPKKLGDDLCKNSEKGPWDRSNVLKEKPSFTSKGEPVFSPFFWLRLREESENDEVERLSSQTVETDHVTGTPMQKYSFDDIKDTNNDSPIKLTATEEVGTEFKLADVFDSEMFEWTQKPCSPELCSTPIKNKVADQNELDRAEENNEKSLQHFVPSSTDKLAPEIVKQGKDGLKMDSFSSRKAKITKASTGGSKSSKSCKSKRKQDSLSDDGIHVEAVGLCRGSHHFGDGTVQNTTNEIRKKNKRATFDMKSVDKETEGATQATEAKFQTQHKEKKGRLTEKENIGSDKNLKIMSCKTAKNSKRSKRNCRAKPNQHDDTTAEKVLKEVSLNKKQSNENGKAQTILSSCHGDEKSCPTSMKANFQNERNGNSNMRKRKRLTHSNNKISNCVVACEGMKSCSNVAAAKNRQPASLSVPENLAVDNLQLTNEIPAFAKNMALQKCENTPGNVCCAFCQSSKDCKDSGKMMHYCNGRPVGPDYNGGSSIIHAHRTCTEWAPNVYFEDENAINLESELARSRKIKCSLCGIRGAALGCFEKSCRKSFHVPCAKLVQQCRWDTENFVMLCPLHPSSKLPKELSGSQQKRQKKCISKRESQAKQADVTVGHGASTNGLWKGLTNKWVLCCSGLTDTEKEIVSEFTKLAGVSLSKTYGPSVTHIITSTDENGACRRTLKFLLGILEGKWILKIDWVKACMESMKPVDEEEYEISVDIHGTRNGPQHGRLRVLNKQPKIFDGCNFYIMGEFLPSYKGYLQDMVIAAGGTLLQRKPISGDMSGLLSASTTYIIYNAELPEECGSAKKSSQNPRQDAEALANATGSKIAGHTWILDSIAACNLQVL